MRPVIDALILHAMRALYPRTEALPGIEDTEPRAFLRQYRREASTLIVLGLVLGAMAFAWSPIVTVYWPLPSFLLPRAVLDRHAMRVGGSRIYLLRQSIFLVKLAAGMCWGQHPRVRERFALSPYPDDPGTWREA